MKNSKIKSVLLSSVVALSGVYIAQAANAFTIDNFNTGDVGIAALNLPGLNNSTATSSGLSSSDTVGTARDIQAFVANPGVFNTTASAFTGNNSTPKFAFVASRTNGPETAIYSIVWDGTAAPTNPLSVTANGFTAVDVQTNGSNPNTAFRFDIVSYDNVRAGSSATLTVYSNAGTDIAVNTIANIGTGSGLGLSTDLIFNFFDFQGTVNFTQITAIRFDLTLLQDPGASSNFGIDIVETVPIPFEFNPAIGVGILGLAWGDNQLRKAKKASVKQVSQDG